MNVIGCIYLAAIAFSVGHAIGWRRGCNYGEGVCSRATTKDAP